MGIREKWNEQADEYIPLDALGADEIEQFADEVIEGLENKIVELKKENAGIRGDFDLLFQHNLWTEDELSELEALKKDARWCAIECNRLRWKHPSQYPDGSSLCNAIDRILEATEEP
jgi:hypothetical protein